MSEGSGDDELDNLEEHPLQQMDRERRRIDRERRRIAQLRKDLEDREQRLREFKELVLGSGSCRSQGTQTSPRTAETQASASEKIETHQAQD